MRNNLLYTDLYFPKKPSHLPYKLPHLSYKTFLISVFVYYCLPAKNRFVDFYTRFVTDSLYQSEHIANPLQFVTIDPDDEFAILETTLDVNQWYAFRPSLPADKLSNINYGQKNEDNSNTKILKVNGIGNGYSNVFYFRRRGGEWKMYKYEDTSI